MKPKKKSRRKRAERPKRPRSEAGFDTGQKAFQGFLKKADPLAIPA